MNDDKGLSGEDVVVMMGDFSAHGSKLQGSKAGAPSPSRSSCPGWLRLANGINSYRNPTPTFPFGESRHCALGRGRSTTPLIAQRDIMKPAPAAAGVQRFPIPPWHLPDSTIMQTSNTTPQEHPRRNTIREIDRSIGYCGIM